MEEFLINLPKIELHAHLNGSLSNQSIKELGESLYGENTKEFLELANELINFGDSVDLSKCFEKFKFVHQLTATPKGLSLATELVIRDFAKDNVVYLELRTTPKDNQYMTSKEYLEIVLETIKKCQDKFKSIMVKLIPSIDRSKPLEQATKTVHILRELKETYGDLIVGLDLSGNPEIGNFQDFKPLLELAKSTLDIPLTLHCAEVENPQEINDMVSFEGMSRCGHGTFLNDDQLKRFAEKKVAIECCLTSNVKSKTVTSFNDHHFQKILHSNQPVVLCTDDSGIFDTTLTNEFMIACQTFNLNKKDVFNLTLYALQYCFADNDEKKYLLDKVIPYFNSIDK